MTKTKPKVSRYESALDAARCVEEVRALMTRKTWSLSHAAKQVGVSPQLLWQWFEGTCLPREEKRKIVRAKINKIP